jgi:hypothetical protein
MMHDKMGNWHWGFGFGHGVFGLLFWLVAILIVAALIKYLLSSKK